MTTYRFTIRNTKGEIAYTLDGFKKMAQASAVGLHTCRACFPFHRLTVSKSHD